MSKKEDQITTEEVNTSSVSKENETVSKEFHDSLIAEKDKEIEDLKQSLVKEQEYSESLEKDYSNIIENNVDEYSHVPLVNIIDGKKVTKEEVITNKKLIKLFKK